MTKLRGKKEDLFKRGFTLVELIIVIAILAVIAAIAAPNLIGNIRESRKNTDIANAEVIANAAMQVIADDESIALPYASTTVAAASADSLISQIEAKLQKIPDVKFTSGGSFSVAIAGDGKVTVTIGGTEVYPDSSGY